MPSSWVVRVASTRAAGLGHLARSTALATALGAQARVSVVLDTSTKVLHERFGSDYFSFAEVQDWLTTQCDGVVLDGYDIVRLEIARWRQQTRFLAVIEDFYSPHPLADFAIAPAPHLVGNRIGDTPAALGGSYALIDPQYANFSRQTRRGGPQHIAVGLGAIDSHGATLLAVDALVEVRTRHPITATILCSSAAAHLSAVQEAVHSAGDWMHLVLDCDSAKDIWSAADIAIGAGGVSFLERLASGCPSICISTSSNQDLALSKIETLGIGIFAGRLENIDKHRLATLCLSFLNDPDRRKAVSERGRSRVDGCGAERAAEILLRTARTFGTTGMEPERP